MNLNQKKNQFIFILSFPFLIPSLNLENKNLIVLIGQFPKSGVSALEMKTKRNSAFKQKNLEGQVIQVRLTKLSTLTQLV